MNRRRIITAAAVASVVLNAALLFGLRGTFGHVIVVFVLAMWVAGSALVAAAVCAVIGRWRAGWRRASWVLLAGAVVCVSGLVSLLPAQWIVERDIAAAEGYCDGFVQQLEQYRQARGNYPSSLSAMTIAPGAPRLVRRAITAPSFYWSDGTRFSLTFGDPRGMMNFISYESDAHRWHTWQ